MCVVSAVTDYGLQKVFPDLSRPIDLARPITPNYDWSGTTLLDYKIVTLTEYNELIRKAKAFDEKTNQPDCHDPEKVAKLEEYCKKLEAFGVEMFKLVNELRALLK